MSTLRPRANDGFTGTISLIFGVLAWAQMPAVCGFMLSSTLVGAENYGYSLWLGGLIALIGLGSGAPSLLKGGRNPLLVAGAVLSVGFFACALLGRDWYGSECRAVFTAFTPDWRAPNN